MTKLPLHKLLIAMALLMIAGTAEAQDARRDRAITAIEIAEQRLEQAQMIVSDSGHDVAEQELAIATDLLNRAKSEFAHDRFGIAIDFALRSKERSERAISLVRGLPDPDLVRAQLERTMELLDRARDQIEECDNDRARAMLHIAAEMQKRAIRSAEEGRLLAALQLTTSARERALKALRLCRLEENIGESAERALGRTSEIIARARERVARAEEDGAPNERARQAIDRATSMQERALSEFQAEHYKSSLRLTQSARALAYRAIRLVRGDR